VNFIARAQAARLASARTRSGVRAGFIKTSQFRRGDKLRTQLRSFAPARETQSRVRLRWLGINLSVPRSVYHYVIKLIARLPPL